MADQNYKLRFDFIANNTKFNSAIGQSSNKLKSFSNQMTKTGRMLSTRLSLPLAALGTLAVRQAAKFERLRVTLNTLTGSADAGAKSFERLVQFSAETPLQLEELTRVNNMLMGFGQSSDDAFKSLKMLGDVSAITGGNLTGIAVAFGQAAAEGRVMTRDLRQFINNGVPILQLLSEEMGVAEGKIMDLASEGKLTFDILNTAFEKATSDGGRFNNGLKILSQTLEGLFSTLKDNINIALAELGQEIAETLNLKDGIPALSKKIGELVKDFKNLDDDTQKFIINAALLAAAIPPITLVLGALISSIATITTAVMALNPLITGLIFVIGTLSTTFLTARASGISFGETLKNLAKSKGSGGAFAALQAGSLAAKLELDALKKSMEGVMGPLQKGQTRNLQNLLFPGATTATTGTSSSISPLEPDAMGGGFLGINPFKLGTGFQSLAGIVTTELPRMTTVTNGFALSLEDMTKKFQDFKVNAIEPVVEATKTFGEQIIPQIGIALRDGFAAIAEGESPLKRIGTILKGLVARLLAAAAAAMLLGAFLGGAGGGSKILTRMGGIKGLFTQFSGIELARGGIVSRPTNALIGEYPGARSNPEVVAPLSKLKTMLGTSGAMQGEFVLRGQDLVVALQRAERNRNRFK
jgi:tape measure domain-containing protein